MQVAELMDLSEWLERHVLGNSSTFEQFTVICEQNATNGTKQPLAEAQNELDDALLNMPMEQLSFGQMEVLEDRGIAQYLGQRGRDFYERLFIRENFDPADAAKQARVSWNLLQSVTRQLIEVQNSLAGLGFKNALHEVDSTKFTARIYFQKDAGIHNMPDLREWAENWDIIARGITESIGERTEDFEIVGASTGSVIIIAWMTQAVAKAFAVVTTHISKAAINIIKVKEAYDKMRHLGEMQDILEERERASIDRYKVETRLIVIGGLKENFADAMDETKTALLERSITKYLDFVEKGGEVDIIVPTAAYDLDGANGVEVRHVKSMVEESRRLKAEASQLRLPPPNNP